MTTPVPMHLMSPSFLAFAAEFENRTSETKNQPGATAPHSSSGGSSPTPTRPRAVEALSPQDFATASPSTVAMTSTSEHRRGALFVAGGRPV